jgi:hypothetical protein
MSAVLQRVKEAREQFNALCQKERVKFTHSQEEIV